MPWICRKLSNTTRTSQCPLFKAVMSKNSPEAKEFRTDEEVEEEAEE